MKLYEKLKEAMGNLEEDTVVEILDSVMADGGTEAAEALEACQKGMDIVGSNFETGEYFIGDLIYAGELMTQAANRLRPALVGGENAQQSGKMILCTVEGDLHDIGKNIVKAMVEASGMEVMDMGINVPPGKIVEKARDEGVHIIGLSGVLTVALEAMKETVEAFQEAGMRNEVRIIIGGAPITAVSREQTGADAWATNPQDTVRICQQWAEEIKSGIW
ncbi:MAG: cobalamin B12-binding domain-containing protein [Blautia sp.]|jgi:dimethylamine corrinoid protein|uniref:cobalamin B12-binding domain-containing protein n=1 Tax=Blautia sp. TaxID=1955243 RepID=UPI003D90B348